MEFKPFDKVLVRDEDDEYWDVQIFSRFIEDNDYPFRCINSSYSQCILYKDNEDFLGTTKPYTPKWEPKVNELVLASNDNKEWFPVFFNNKMCEPCKNIKYVCNCVLYDSNYTHWRAFNYIKSFKQENM